LLLLYIIKRENFIAKKKIRSVYLNSFRNSLTTPFRITVGVEKLFLNQVYKKKSVHKYEISLIIKWLGERFICDYMW